MYTQEKFWDKAEKKANGCWEWKGKPDKDGYGTLSYGGNRKAYAHRIAYELSTGTNPGKNMVLHTCDNRLCINPDHLYAGNHQDNMDDVRIRNRRKGEKSATAKLTWEQVKFIRKSDAGPAELSRVFGVSDTQIYRIKHNLRWVE